MVLSSDGAVALVWGIILTLSLELLLLLLWLRRQPVATPSENEFPPFIRTRSPQALKGITCEEERNAESCEWFNLVTDFLYQELRDTETAKRLIMKQIKKEFKEFLLTKTEGKMFEELKVREYSMGESLPLLSNIKLIKIEREDDTPNEKLETIEWEVSVEYTGSFEIGIDAQLMFGRSAYVSLVIRQLNGRGRFQITRKPFTHWSFAFLEEPATVIDVTSRFEGRNLPRLSVFLESQFRRWIRRAHTLPFYKVRFKPFFRRFNHHDQLQDVYLHDELLTNGELDVKLVECSRLRLVDIAIDVYCTLSIDSEPQEPMVGLWKNLWPYHDITISKLYHKQRIGMKYKLYQLEGDRGSLVIISSIEPGSPALEAGIMKGDILSKVDNVKINNIEQAQKLITKHAKVLITIQRPTTDLLKRFTSKRSKTTKSQKLRKARTSTTIERRGMEEFEVIKNENKSDSEITEPTHQGAPDTRSLVGVAETITPTADTVINETIESSSQQSHDKSRDRFPRKHKTKAIAVSRNPVWEEVFKFKLTSNEYRYLNVCVWSHLRGDEGEVMIGYVSISLTDLSVECSLTNNGVHQQRYTLVPAKASKIGTSRAALKVTSGHSELPATAKMNKLLWTKKYVGDIMLQFKHKPIDIKQKKKKRKDSHKETTHEASKKFSHPPFTADEECEPSNHRLAPIDLKISLGNRCNICDHRLWKKAWRCRRCLIEIDDKCRDYCKRMVPCHSKGGEEEEIRLRVEGGETDQDWTILEGRDDKDDKEESYSDSRTLYRRIDEDPVTEPIIENTNTMEVIDGDCQNVTPVESDNSTTEDENGHRHPTASYDIKSHEMEYDIEYDMEYDMESRDREENQSLEVSRESSRSPAIEDKEELMKKIIMAQESLELLAEQKRDLESSVKDSMTPEERERSDYMLEKIAAQQEATEELLKHHKEFLRTL